MSHLIPTQQISRALTQSKLGYVEQQNPNIAAQLACWLTALLQSPRNLTATRTPESAIAKHVIEPLSGRHRLLNADVAVPHAPLIDIGSGNGAPGLPIALCEPEPRATLLDAKQASADFLSDVVAQLSSHGLLNAHQLEVVHDRAELAAHTDLRERFGIAVSRAATSPAAALELAVPFLHTGGLAVLWTAPIDRPELDQLSDLADALGAELTPIGPPQDILVATKTRPTDPRFPRPWNQIRRGPPLPASTSRERHPSGIHLPRVGLT